MADVVVMLVLLVIVGAAVIYIRKEKKKGTKCIGCPVQGGCSGDCSGSSECNGEE